MRKMFLSFCLAIVMLAVFVFPCFAVDTSPPEGMVAKQVTLAETSIEEDFENLKNVEGSTFNINDYPAIRGEDPRLFTVVEDCKLPTAYALWVYIYNPGKINFDKKYFYAQLSFDGVNYYKFPANFFEWSSDGLFAKFRIEPKSVYWQHFSQEQRFLHFSGFELSYKDLKGINFFKEYAAGSYLGSGIGNLRQSVTFTFEGNNPSKMTYAEGTDLLNLDLNLTYYRTSNENSDEGEYNQLTTVFFKIPNKYFEGFGDLKNAHYEFKKYENLKLNISNFDAFAPNDDLNLPLGYGRLFYQYGNVPGRNTFKFLALHAQGEITDDLYNSLDDVAFWEGKFSDARPQCPGHLLEKNDECPECQKYYITKHSDSMQTNYVQDNSLKLSSQELISFYKNHPPASTNAVYVNRNVSLDNINDIFFSNSYASMNNFWNKWSDFGLLAALRNDFKDDSFEAAPIVICDYSDRSLSDKKFSEKYLIEESEVSYIKQALSENHKLVLLRVDLTKYKVDEADLYIFKNSFGRWTSRRLDDLSDNDNDYRYLFTQNTLYEDVDVIDLTFVKDETAYVIPIVSDPIKYYASDTMPPEEGKDKFFDEPPSYMGLVILCFSAFVAIICAKPVSKLIGNIFGGVHETVQNTKRKRGKK